MKLKFTPRIALVVIAAMFVLPLALAWLMYNGTIDYKPASTRNLGQLVDPPLPMSWEELEALAGDDEQNLEPADTFYEHWVILYPVPDPCAELCLSEVTDLRQIHRASGRHQSRIRIALLVPAGTPPAVLKSLRDNYAEFHLVVDPAGKLAKVLEQATAQDSSAYLIDPLGNIMMAYEPGADPNQLKQDLKRLLTWSKLDEQ